MKKALGLIETIGLAAAIEAADAAVKAANVALLGYENTKGSGKITIKIAGDVGAVNAGVAAGAAAAARVGRVYGQAVIPRPHQEIDALIENIDRGPLATTDTPPDAAVDGEVEMKPAAEPAVPPETEATEPKTEAEETETAVDAEEEPEQCIAETKSGERCKLPAQPGSRYCFVHRKLHDEEA